MSQDNPFFVLPAAGRIGPVRKPGCPNRFQTGQLFQPRVFEQLRRLRAGRKACRIETVPVFAAHDTASHGPAQGVPCGGAHAAGIGKESSAAAFGLPA